MNVEGYPILGVISSEESNLKLPVYQRRYTWEKENCKVLFKDIVFASIKNREHFLGSVVRVDFNLHSKVRVYLIIDGQQRITSVCLLLKALMDHDTCDDRLKDEIRESLYNKANKKTGYIPNSDNRIRLILTSKDDEQYKLLMDNNLSSMSDSLIRSNYLTFKDWIDKAVSKGLTCEDIYRGIEKLQVACITIVDGSDDSPQEVFESLNTTGVELAFADKAKNYLFMGDFNQDIDYKHWDEIESNTAKNLDDFILDYLRFSTGTRINSGTAYSEFKGLLKFGFNNDSLKMLLEMKKCSGYYAAFLKGSNKYSRTVNDRLDELRDLQQTTVYPFLLHLFDDFSRNIIDKAYLDKIMDLLVSYIIRRRICNVPTNSLSGFFTSMYNRIFPGRPLTKEKITPKKYYETILGFLGCQGNTNNKIPGDDEIRSSILNTADYYSNTNDKKLVKIMLEYVENATVDGYESPEKMDFSDFQVEHIMPQDLGKYTEEWHKIMGDDPDDTRSLLNTFGNLSLTAQNSQMSNKPFDVKQGMIECNSKLKLLNEDVMNSTMWTRKEITNRANHLIEVLLLRLKIEISPEIANAFKVASSRVKQGEAGDNGKTGASGHKRQPTITGGTGTENGSSGNSSSDIWVSVADDYNFTGTHIDKFSFNGKEHHASSYTTVLKKLANELYNEDITIMEAIAGGGHKTSKKIQHSKDDMIHSSAQIGESGIFINTHGSTKDIIHIIRSLLEDYNIDVSSVKVHLTSSAEVHDEMSSESNADSEISASENSDADDAGVTDEIPAEDTNADRELSLSEAPSGEDDASQVADKKTGSDSDSEAPGSADTEKITLSYDVNDKGILHTSKKRKGMSITAYGRYNADTKEMTVLEGSQIDLFKDSPSLRAAIKEERSKALQSGDIIKTGETYILQKAMKFKSSSTAAMFVYGSSVNGYDVWTNKDGIKLGKLIHESE
ncbi:MAG: DUF4357 domain-containing protein [Clostridia bacterium]|nr:DUF4357 domain-containing protein [Clostridia bacterium]